MELIIAAKAGRLNLVGGKTLVPDPRRGLLRVVQSDEGLLHVEWLVRDASESSGQTEPEMTSVIFPEECRLEQASKRTCLSSITQNYPASQISRVWHKHKHAWRRMNAPCEPALAYQ